MALTHPSAPTIDVRQYGAACDGITDDSTAVNLAMAAAVANSYRLVFPSGFTTSSGRATCVIGSQIATVLTSTQTLWISGHGRDVSRIQVPSTFSLVSTGAISITSPGGTYTDAGGIEDLTIKFYQPDTAVIGDKIHYPPAIYTTGTNHLKIRRVNIECAWNGIQVVTVNGITFEDLAISAYSTAITLDESFDGGLFDGVLLWPVGMTTNQATLWGSTAETTGFSIGQVDSLSITNCNLLTTVRSLDFHAGSTGHKGSTGTVSGCWFDSVGNIIVTAGSLRFIGNYVSFAADVLGLSTSAFHITGAANVTVDSCQIYVATAGAPVFRFQPNGDLAQTASLGKPGLKVTNTQIIGASYDNYTFLIQSLTPATKASVVTISNVSIEKDPTVAYTNPMIGVAAPTGGTCQLRLSGLDITSLTSGTGVALNIAADDYHKIGDDNTYNGWTNTIPTTIAKMKFPLLPGLVYATVASGTSITPTGPIFNVSGTTTITTITVPTGWQYQRIRITKTDAGSVTIGGGGNIPGSYTLAQYGALDFTWNGTSWL